MICCSCFSFLRVQQHMYDQGECGFIYKVKSVERVVDGDTMDVVLDLGFDTLTKQRVRLLGIDTPESRTRDETEKKFGLLSKKVLKDFVQKSKDNKNAWLELRCKERDSRGKFGRVLAEVWYVDGDTKVNINKHMCDEGFAVPYVGQNKKDVEALHLENREKVKHMLEE